MLVWEEPNRFIELTFYPPEMDMPLHVDGIDRISLLLGGSLLEQSEAGAFEVGLGHLVLKPSDFRHRTLTGPSGVVVLSLGVTGGSAIPNYQWQSQTALSSLALSALRQGTLFYLAATLASIEPTLPKLSHTYGSSPSAITRRYRALHGETRTETLRRQRCQEAARCISSGSSLGEAAITAGFADQAHFTRTFKKVFGIAPGAYFRLLNELR